MYDGPWLRVEEVAFVASKTQLTKPYAMLIFGLCRHLPISAVTLSTGLRWDVVKSIDPAYLAETTRRLRRRRWKGIRYLSSALLQTQWRSA